MTLVTEWIQLTAMIDMILKKVEIIKTLTMLHLKNNIKSNNRNKNNQISALKATSNQFNSEWNHKTELFNNISPTSDLKSTVKFRMVSTKINSRKCMRDIILMVVSLIWEMRQQLPTQLLLLNLLLLMPSLMVKLSLILSLNIKWAQAMSQQLQIQFSLTDLFIMLMGLDPLEMELQLVVSMTNGGMLFKQIRVILPLVNRRKMSSELLSKLESKEDMTGTLTWISTVMFQHIKLMPLLVIPNHFNKSSWVTTMLELTLCFKIIIITIMFKQEQ